MSPIEAYNAAAKTLQEASEKHTELHRCKASLGYMLGLLQEDVDRQTATRAQQLIASLSAEQSVLEINTKSRDLAAEQVQECERQLAAAEKAETAARAALEKAQLVLARETLHQALADIGRLLAGNKSVAQALALLDNDVLRSEVFTDRPHGVHVHWTQPGQIALGCPFGSPRISAASTLLSLIDGKRYPEAASALQAKVDENTAAIDKRRKQLIAELDQLEGSEVARIERDFTVQEQQAGYWQLPVIAVQKRVRVAEVKSRYEAERARIH